MESLCIRCKGKGLCGQKCKILAKFQASSPKVKLHFSGSSPPEVFVGRMGYPNIYSGILAPDEKGETGILSNPELWVSNKLSIEEILGMRARLIYGRKVSNVKTFRALTAVMQEVALTSRPVSTEFFLDKLPRVNFNPSKVFTIMTNTAQVKKVILEENPKVEKKVDYLVSDYDIKATDAIRELYSSGILTSHLSKILSAGLLGVKTARKLVPTRWSITAVDDMLSKSLLEKIREYPEINEIQVFSSNYNGNHYNFLLLPGSWAFEVIEAELPGNLWNPSLKIGFMQDYEGFWGRKEYASSVTGAYYANRLGICEYLEKIKRKATVLVLREVREEYYAPLGVGILRETTREAFSKSPEICESLDDAMKLMQSRFKINLNEYVKRSWILKNYGKQKKISEFFN